MRYQKGRKDESRQLILDVASRRFRRDGIAATGLAGLMADAGLTHGAFYAHFGSKEDLVRESLRTIRAASAVRADAEARAAPGDDTETERWLRRYLSPRHRDDVAGGCVVAALAAELGRHPAETREVLHAGIEATVATIAGRLPAGEPAERLATARAVFGLMVGTLQFARVVGDGAESDAILDDGVRAALCLIERTCGRERPSGR